MDEIEHETGPAGDGGGRDAFCGAAAAFGRFGLCRAAGGSGAAHFGGRHSGVVPQRAHGRAGKAAGAAVCQSEKAALGQGAPPAELSAHPAGGGAGAGAGPDAADPGAGAVLPQPVSAN